LAALQKELTKELNKCEHDVVHNFASDENTMILGQCDLCNLFYVSKVGDFFQENMQTFTLQQLHDLLSSPQDKKTIIRLDTNHRS